jgi:tRNA A37 threonylcarbamoyladenosine synthetase subunit TsaC/SUA5/YrdC
MVSDMTMIERYGVSTASVLADRMRRVLGENGLIALPTESFYGLAVDPFNEQALARLWQIKGRSEGKPILVLIGEGDQLEPFVRNIPPAAAVLMNALARASYHCLSCSDSTLRRGDCGDSLCWHSPQCLAAAV